MKPVIVTTPRTGSTLVTGLLHNLAHQWWGSKNNLREYFTLNPLYKEEWETIDGVITRTSYVRLQEKDFNIDQEEKNRRLRMLASDSNYTFKIFSSDFTPDIEQFVRENYTVIYLERRDKIAQLLSFMNLYDTNVSHYAENSAKIDQITYNRGYTGVFLSILKRYYELKSRLPGTMLWYEDFMDQGADEKALIQLLNLPDRQYTPMKWNLVRTPYNDEPARLITNEHEWLRDLPHIRARIQKMENHELL